MEKYRNRSQIFATLRIQSNRGRCCEDGSDMCFRNADSNLQEYNAIIQRTIKYGDGGGGGGGGGCNSPMCFKTYNSVLYITK